MPLEIILLLINYGDPPPEVLAWAIPGGGRIVDTVKKGQWILSSKLKKKNY